MLTTHQKRLKKEMRVGQGGAWGVTIDEKVKEMKEVRKIRFF